MFTSMKLTTLLALLFVALSQSLHPATVEALKGGASARMSQAVKPGESFTTRKSSQSQLRLNKGFVRLGSSSQVEMGKEDSVHLKQGVMMVGSGGERNRDTVKVSAPGYNFQVQGTALIAYYPGQYIKITVLEGSIRVALQSLLGEFETLEPGQMLVINPADNRLPDPVEVDLNRLVTTSQLTAGPLGPAPTDPFIQSSVIEQGAEKGGGFLVQTPFALRGASPEVTVFQLVNDLDNPNALVDQTSFLGPGATNHTALSNVEITRRGAKTRTLLVPMSPPNDTDPASLGGTITVNKDVYGGTPKKLAFNVNDGSLRVEQNASITTPEDTALDITARTIEVQDGATLQAGNGETPAEKVTLIAYGHADLGGAPHLSLNNATVKGGIAEIRGTRGLNLQKIDINNTDITAPKGINVGLSTAASTIHIRNSSQLLALAGTIAVDGGDVTQGVGGPVEIANSTLNAEVIKARGHSANGDAVIVDGGSFVANTVLKFFATGASVLRFRGAVNLTSPLSILSARTVQVDLGGAVTATGRIDVYTDNANFNVPGIFGTLKGSNGAANPNVMPFDTVGKPTFEGPP